jgi:hypothetical protein
MTQNNVPPDSPTAVPTPPDPVSDDDPRPGGHADRAPRSLHAVELEADDEPVASNDEWDDPERL